VTYSMEGGPVTTTSQTLRPGARPQVALHECVPDKGEGGLPRTGAVRRRFEEDGRRERGRGVRCGRSVERAGVIGGVPRDEEKIRGDQGGRRGRRERGMRGTKGQTYLLTDCWPRAFFLRISFIRSALRNIVWGLSNFFDNPKGESRPSFLKERALPKSHADFCLCAVCQGFSLGYASSSII